MGLISICNALGRVLFGGMYDKYGRSLSMQLVNGLFIVTSVVLLLAMSGRSVAVVIAGFVLGGLAFAAMWVGSYKLVEKILTGIVIFMGVVFLITAIASSPDWGAVVAGMFIPTIPQEGSAGILTVVGLIGTTIVPYNLFLHASSAAERWKDPDQIGDARFDAVLSIGLGGVISNGKEEREIEAGRTIVAAGRRGADWLETLCAEHGIAHQPGTVDIGVRVEVRNEIMETVNEVLYESKLIGYPAPFKNKVRTFCQNPGGFVSQENYDNGLAVVNGHSFKEVKSPNTNLSILCSHNFSVPFNQPIAYAQKVGELTNMLGAGHILVQRYGDILDGKRTWEKELAQSNVRPTLPDAVAGDITAAMPYRAMTNIINFIQAMDYVVPGFAAYETLLYSPELKFYSNRVKMDTDFNTSLQGLHCLGDSSGWTRGLMMASVMGTLMGRKIAEEG